ncbi:hypothetical protein COF63_24840 [Bacillus pseudomycoides]|nr:hypothetical protein CON86_29310 [Bacillus pseudomycoides]PEM69749.1 hypothetical protein CN632_24945 [Bacillus pseudomycoides]PHC80573.1 hypothetical protein COF63_24840 [Bacillus pseudomycoides]
MFILIQTKVQQILKTESACRTEVGLKDFTIQKSPFVTLIHLQAWDESIAKSVIPLLNRFFQSLF